MTDLARRAFDHRADLLAALVYGCLAFLSFSALSEYANAHDLFPLPYGGWAFAVAIDGMVLYAFISFRRARVLASALLVSGAATSFVLQQWHSSNDHHPAVVAGVVPATMVLVTFAWHRIKAAETPAPEGAVPPTAAPPGPVQPSKPRTSLDRTRVSALLDQGRNMSQIQRELGLSKRQYNEQLRPLVAEIREGRLVPSRNGSGP